MLKEKEMETQKLSEGDALLVCSGLLKLFYTFILSEIAMLKKISLFKTYELETERQLKKSFDPAGNYIHCI